VKTFKNWILVLVFWSWNLVDTKIQERHLILKTIQLYLKYGPEKVKKLCGSNNCPHFVLIFPRW